MPNHGPKIDHTPCRFRSRLRDRVGAEMALHDFLQDDRQTERNEDLLGVRSACRNSGSNRVPSQMPTSSMIGIAITIETGTE